MKLSQTDLQAWLDSEPDPEHLIELDNGVRVIPYRYIESYLDFLAEQHEVSWNTTKFNRVFTVLNGVEAIDVSIEIDVPAGQGIRTLVGCATYALLFIRDGMGASMRELTGDINEHYSATAKSFAIVNAAKHLGRRFGKYLNIPEEMGEEKLPVTQIKKDFLSDVEETENSRMEGLFTVIKTSHTRGAAERVLNQIANKEQIKKLMEAIDKKFPTFVV